MVQTKRRSVIKLAGSAAAVASTGMAGILASGRTPAYAQQKTVHWLRWVDFVPASDTLLRKELIPAAEKELGMKINLETVNGNDLQPRATAAIQSGSGPDLIMAFNNYTYIYANSVVDVSDIAEELSKREGGIYKYCRSFCSDGKMFMAMPWAVIGAMVAYRKSWFEEAGFNAFPQTWQEYHDAGKKLKAKGRPIGQTLGHTFGDAPTFTYPFMWSWGGKEVEADGKTVAINSKETIESVKFMTGFWKDCCDEGGLAWDDTNNNRAFLSGTISATLNGASIYIETLRKPDQYQTEKGKPMKEDIMHSPLPKGPAGQFGMHLMQSDMLMKYSKNQAAAKEFLRWIHAEKNYGKWFESQKGYSTPPTTKWESSPVWNADPVLAPFKVAARLGQAPGYAGPPNAKAAEGLSKYIITDMYAKAVQGMAPEESVKWAEGELKKIYSA
ncbi:extracellular solute-binding protein [Enhydrobacter sp.]|uniref:ABC transporter substrate-binding protein n=1 Tax=Enhydrobacter sp. TaxID=1894999 RepID=UPI002639F0E4|nr:extracellular solute-binding protein [Enhydrobacter sp.]WIM10405.1 MAG: ABC transporter, substrate-binding protein (cluster 1, maltose/g3p/polyamine/iron) [Enhydrobacter sp.]